MVFCFLAFTLLAQAESPMIWDGVYAQSLASGGFEHADGKLIIPLTSDPSSGAGYAANIGSIGQRNNSNSGEFWLKTGANDTDWTLMPTSGGTPGGSNTQVQYNDSGVFGGKSTFTFDKSTDTLLVSGILSVPGTGTRSQNFGPEAAGSGNFHLALNCDSGTAALNMCAGLGASNNGGGQETAVGISAVTSGGGGSTSTGYGASASNGSSSYGTNTDCRYLAVCFGRGTFSYDGSVGFNIVVGYSSGFSNVSTNRSLLFAVNYTVSDALTNVAIFGSPDTPYADWYIGEGYTSPTPSDTTLHVTSADASASDIQAGKLILAGGRSSGNATQGNVEVQTTTPGSSGTTLQTLTTRVSVDNANLEAKNGTHLKSTGTSPGATVTSNAGTGATCGVSNATDTAGLIELVTTGTSPSSGEQCHIDFNTAYAVAPICVVTGANDNEASFAATSDIYFTTTTAKLSINFGSADPTGHTYDFMYFCIETQ